MNNNYTSRPNNQDNRNKQPYNSNYKQRPRQNNNYVKNNNGYKCLNNPAQIDYRKKDFYFKYPVNLESVRMANEEELLGWYRFLEDPKNDEQTRIMNAIIAETKHRYCRRPVSY